MTYDRYQIELGVLQKFDDKIETVQIYGYGHAVSVFGGRHSD